MKTKKNTTLGILMLLVGVVFISLTSSGPRWQKSITDDCDTTILNASQDTCPTGKEGNIWFLGEHGLDFNTGSPSEYVGFGSSVYETQTSICDSDGNLLMYFDGGYLYDRSHSYLLGSSLPPVYRELNRGGSSSSQSMFLKHSNNDSLYYLFYTEEYGNDTNGPDTAKNLWYTIVNIKGNGGLGEVVGQRKRKLLQPSTEKVTAVPHCNGRDYWVIGSEGGGNRFFAWLLDKDSLHQSSPVISLSGSGNSGRGAQKGGFLKPSHDGSKLCEIIAYHRANIHDFNTQNGVISNGISIVTSNDLQAMYGCEFSPNNSKLYLTGYSVWQLDLWAGNLQDIRSSLTKLISINGGAPTLGPDGKIYVTKFSLRSNGLVVIDHPNRKGLACQTYDDQDLMSIRSGLGAPNFPAGFLFPDRLYTRYPDTTICMDSIAPVWVTGPCDHHNTTWQLLDGGQLNLVHEDSVELQFNRPGTYRLVAQAESRCGLRYDTIELKVVDCSPPPQDTCPSGKEGNIWFLGEHGLDFNIGSPSEYVGFGSSVYETQTSICDSDGNLLMYFNGGDLYDRSHNYLQGSTFPPVYRELNRGGSSSTQSIFLKHPNNDSLYYLFYTENFGNNTNGPDTAKILWYTIVNIKGNGGLGEVVGQRKRKLLQPSTEKVTAIPHCNGRDYWVIGSEGGSNRFFAWLLGKDSLHQNSPVISASGQGNDGLEASKGGFLKPSNDGNNICEIVTHKENMGMMNLHEFDQNTGQITRGVQLISSTDGLNLYGCEFSPNNSKLYLTGYSVWQLDLWAGDLQDIRNSLTFLTTAINGGAPTLGSDGKIYITKFNSRSSGMVVIDHPNRKGLACQAYDDQDLMSIGTGLGAPNFPAGFLFPDRLYSRYPDTTICMDSIAPVWVTGPCDHHNTTWQLLDGGQLNLVHEDSVELQFNRPGTYRLVAQAESRCGLRYDTIELKVRDCECTSLSGAFVPPVDTVHICDKDTVRLEHDGLHQLGPTDSLFFVLHDRSDDTLGQVIAYFGDDRCFYKAGLEYNRLYYFSAVTGAHQGGQILKDDPCLSVVPGIPVIFHQQPQFLSINVPEKRCQDSCVDITIELQGNPSYLFQVRAERVVGGNVIPAEYKSTTLNSLTFSWCQDTLNLGALQDTYCFNNDSDTTIVLDPEPLPKTAEISFDESICKGDSFELVVQSNASKIYIIDSHTGHQDSLSGGSIHLGPIDDDSCYTLRTFNELGCYKDTIFCVTVIPDFHTTDTIYICYDDTLNLADGRKVYRAGIYHVDLISDLGCDSTATIDLRVHSQSKYQIMQGASCWGQMNGRGGLSSLEEPPHIFSVLWSDGDTSHHRSDLSPGQYSLIATDQNGCTFSTDIETRVRPRPIIRTYSRDEICAGESNGWVMIDGDSISYYELDGVRYELGDTVKDLSPGTYSIDVTGYYSSCVYSNQVDIAGGDDLDITLPSKVEMVNGFAELPLLINFNNPRSIQWTPNYALNCNKCQRPIASPNRDTTYYVTVTTHKGCEITASIEVLTQNDVFVPTSFTPNGDNINDVFRPYFSNSTLPYSLTIFNRWGELVYNCSGSDCGWDGTFEGQPLPPAVYIYILEYPLEDKKSQSQGSITLMR